MDDLRRRNSALGPLLHALDLAKKNGVVAATLSLEVLFVAFLFILASWYWAIDEHVVYISLFSVSTLLAIDRGAYRRDTRRGPTAIILFLVFLAWVLVSTTWSGVFHLSLSYAVISGLVGTLGLIVSLALPLRSVLLGILGGAIFISSHAWLLGGSTIIGEEVWRIEGLFTNISSMSFLLGVGFLAAVTANSQSVALRIVASSLAVWLFIQIFSLDVLTTLFATTAALAVMAMSVHVRNATGLTRRFLIWFYPGFVSFTGLVFWFFREPLLRPLGEGPDLSGRVILWNWYFEAFLWRPIIGGGWGNSPGWPPLDRDRLEPVKEFFPAHNGFIDIGLALGGVGVLLMVATLVTVLIEGARRAADIRLSSAYLFIPSLITYLTLNDLMATSLPRLIGLFLVGTMVGIISKKPEPSFQGLERVSKLPQR